MHDNPSPLTFDNLWAARAAADEAVERVDRHADPTWRADAMTAVEHVARTRHELTSDDVWSTMSNTSDAHTHDPRAMGPIMRAARAAGWIVPTDRYRASGHTVNHNRPQRVWRSLIADT